MQSSKHNFEDIFFSFMLEYGRLERLMCERSGLYSGQPRVLTTLMSGDGITLKELAYRTGLGPSSLSVSVRNMEKSGLLRKEVTPGDHRTCLIYLTEKGYGHAALFHQLIQTYFSELNSSFEADMPVNLENTLGRLLDITGSYYEQLKQHFITGENHYGHQSFE